MLSGRSVLLFLLIFLFALTLRVFQLGNNPPGLYWEEVALGYDAYSVWNTGSDHHGNQLPIIAFESFGDWKPSLYFYAVAPFVGIFGLNAWSVRAPSVIAGLVIVVGMAVLSILIFEKITNKKDVSVGLIAAFVAAINPWAMHFSRAAWEVNLATSLILWGVIFGLMFWKSKKIIHLFFSAIFLIFSMYAYHSARVIAPSMGLFLLSTFILKNKKNLKKIFKDNQRIIILPVLFLTFLLAPFAVSFGKQEMTQRFAETSIFSDISIIEQSNFFIEQSQNDFLSRFFYHRYLLFGREIIKNFMSHLDFKFLFVSGDANPRHSIQFFGHFYYIDLIFLFLGIFYLIKKKNTTVLFLLLFWLAIGILPSAISIGSPHALRILPTLPIFIVLISLGIYQFFALVRSLSLPFFLKQKKFFYSLVVFCYLFFFSWYYYVFFTIYPEQYASHWQAEYPALIQEIETFKKENPGKTIAVSRELGRPAMYYWFYTSTDPLKVQKVASQVEKDQGEFLEFENLRFERESYFLEGQLFMLLEENY